MIRKPILLKTSLNEPELICLHIVKWFLVLLFTANHLLAHS